MTETATKTAVTLDEIMAWNPCYSREKLEKLAGGKTSITPLEILDLPFIPHNDKMWAVLREDFIPRTQLFLLACDFAEAALPIFERDYPNDNRPRNCIETNRRYLRGEATSDETAAASAAASDAASAAARAAARDAASAAARAAVWDAARDAQIEMIKKALSQ